MYLVSGAQHWLYGHKPHVYPGAPQKRKKLIQLNRLGNQSSAMEDGHKSGFLCLSVVSTSFSMDGPTFTCLCIHLDIPSTHAK
jgi:hypothetical protein